MRGKSGQTSPHYMWRNSGMRLMRADVAYPNHCADSAHQLVDSLVSPAEPLVGFPEPIVGLPETLLDLPETLLGFPEQHVGLPETLLGLDLGVYQEGDHVVELDLLVSQNLD